MSIHSIACEPGVDVADILAREEYGEDTIESQDNPGRDDYAELRAVEAVYARTMRRVHRRRVVRRDSAVRYELPSYGD